MRSIEPTIIKLEPYGDHRDAKSDTYKYSLPFSNIIYDLTDEDACFIASALNKNILNGSCGYEVMTNYGIWERGTERWAEVTVQDKAKTLKGFNYIVWTDTVSNQLKIMVDHNTIADASACMEIYEYFLRVCPKRVYREGGYIYVTEKKQVNLDDWIIKDDTLYMAGYSDADEFMHVVVSSTDPKININN